MEESDEISDEFEFSDETVDSSSEDCSRVEWFNALGVACAFGFSIFSLQPRLGHLQEVLYDMHSEYNTELSL